MKKILLSLMAILIAPVTTSTTISCGNNYPHVPSPAPSVFSQLNFAKQVIDIDLYRQDYIATKKVYCNKTRDIDFTDGFSFVQMNPMAFANILNITPNNWNVEQIPFSELATKLSLIGMDVKDPDDKDAFAQLDPTLLAPFAQPNSNHNPNGGSVMGFGKLTVKEKEMLWQHSLKMLSLINYQKTHFNPNDPQGYDPEYKAAMVDKNRVVRDRFMFSIDDMLHDNKPVTFNSRLYHYQLDKDKNVVCTFVVHEALLRLSAFKVPNQPLIADPIHSYYHIYHETHKISLKFHLILHD